MRKIISIAFLLLMTGCQTKTPSTANIVGRLNMFGGPRNPSFSAELLERHEIVIHKYEDGAMVSHRISLTESIAKEIHMMWREAFFAPSPPAEIGGRQTMDGLKIVVSIKEGGALKSGEVLRINGIHHADPRIRNLVERVNGLISKEEFKLY